MPSSPEYSRAWRERNPDKVRAYNKRNYEKHRAWNVENRAHMVGYNRDYHLQNKYGISWEEREALAWLQVYRCLCCGEEKELVVDHCHQTNLVRGLLCQLCNLMVGAARDRGDILVAGAKYLGAL